VLVNSKTEREDAMNAYAAEYSPEFTMETDEFAFEEEYTGEAGVFSEAELMELATELLEVSDENELDQFLGKLIKRAGRAVGKFVKSPAGKAIGGVLKGVAKKALPIAGGAVGGFFGGPLGAQLGSGLASAAGSAFGLEAYEMNEQDEQFEGAKQFVKMAGDTVQQALATGGANAAAAAQAAAQKHLPGLFGGRGGQAGGKSGKWIRQGRNILVVNA